MLRKKTMLGEQIKQRRQQEKLTQRELAKLLNTSPANISKWENNKTKPKKEFLEQLQKLWNVSFNASKSEPQSQTTESQSAYITTNKQEIETNASKQQELIANNEKVQEVNKIDASKQQEAIVSNEQEIETNATKQQELIASNEKVQEVNKIDTTQQQELIANNEQEIETNASKQQEPIANNEQEIETNASKQQELIASNEQVQ